MGKNCASNLISVGTAVMFVGILASLALAVQSWMYIDYASYGEEGIYVFQGIVRLGIGTVASLAAGFTLHGLAYAIFNLANISDRMNELSDKVKEFDVKKECSEEVTNTVDVNDETK